MRKDDVTQELPGVPKRPGRPPTGKAMDAAARKRAQRQRLAAEGRGILTVDLPEDVMVALRSYVDRQNADTAKEPVTLSMAIERVLRDRLLRPR